MPQSLHDGWFCGTVWVRPYSWILRCGGFFRNYPFPLLLIYLNLASSNRLPQRPYMVLFIILSLLFVPSTKPLLYSYATAFSIASISRLNPSAKLFSGFRALLLYFSTNKYNKGTFRFLNILRNSFIQQCSSQIFGYFSKEAFLKRGSRRVPVPCAEEGAGKDVQCMALISDLILSAEELGNIKRMHWSIENRLHHVLDDTFREDRSPAKKSRNNLSLIRKYAYNILRLAMYETGLTNIMTEMMDCFCDNAALREQYVFQGIASLYWLYIKNTSGKKRCKGIGR